MDEPASALDPIATQRIEEGIHELKSQLSICLLYTSPWAEQHQLKIMKLSQMFG